jgi:methylated-DNA-[protein]-cysteine S-methyltransferase
MRRLTTTIDSPIGPLRLVGDGDSLTGVYMDGHQPAPVLDDVVEDAGGVFPAAAAQLERYFAGESRAFDVPVALHGTPFQRAVWEELLSIPYGSTATYGELAARLGRPSASRAVGAATGRNPVSIVVPCHRVVGSSGALTGYAGGVPRKRALLTLEGALLS